MPVPYSYGPESCAGGREAAGKTVMLVKLKLQIIINEGNLSVMVLKSHCDKVSVENRKSKIDRI
jgi:hypothetical protein